MTNAFTAAVTNIVTMVDDPWPSLQQFGTAFSAGLLALAVLYLLVGLVMWGLRWKARTLEDFKEEKPVRFSTTFAFVEQSLMFLAAVAGREVFSFAVGGWLVFKSVSRYSRWQSSDESAESPSLERRAQEAGMTKAHYRAAIAHNRFLIFLLGTGLSIAAGGIAGLVYHYVLHIKSS